MKISCTQENLHQGLSVVSHVASRNTTLPILNNILIQAKRNEITFSATNLEIGIRCNVRGKVEQEGDFTVQSRLLADYVSFLPKERVDLQAPESTAGDQTLSITCKNHATKIKGQNASDFPLIPSISGDRRYTLQAADFRQAIGQVIFATATSETRPEINGVFFSFVGGKLTLAATDSYRLAEKQLELKGGSLDATQVIVPTKTLQELQRILGIFKDPASISDSEAIDLYLAENQVLFVFGGIELISRLVEGQYPNYQQIIPQTWKTKTVIGSEDFSKATKTTSLFARSGIYDVALTFLVKNAEVVVSSTNNQLGESTARVSAEVTGDDNDIVVNYRYLLDGLQNMPSGRVELAVIDGGSPCVLRPVGKSQDYLYIIMPIKQ